MLPVYEAAWRLTVPHMAGADSRSCEGPSRLLSLNRRHGHLILDEEKVGRGAALHRDQVHALVCNIVIGKQLYNIEFSTGITCFRESSVSTVTIQRQKTECRLNYGQEKVESRNRTRNRNSILRKEAARSNVELKSCSMQSGLEP